MSIIPAKDVLLELYQGSTFDEPWQFWDDEDETIPTNLTGWGAALHVRKDAEPNSPLILGLTDAVFTPPAGDGIVMGGAAGTVRIYIRDETLAALSRASFTEVLEEGVTRYLGKWDFEMTNTAGETSRYAMGDVEFFPEVTRL